MFDDKSSVYNLKQYENSQTSLEYANLTRENMTHQQKPGLI